MKKISSRLVLGLMTGWLLLAPPAAAQTSTGEYMEPLPDDEAELVVYSDTCTFETDTVASIIGHGNPSECILVEDDGMMWDFFSDVLGMGFFVAMFVALLLLSLPLLVLILLFYLIYRSTRNAKISSGADTLKVGIRQASVGVALVVMELWFGLGGLLGCIGVLLICLAGGRILIARITAHRHADIAGKASPGANRQEEGHYRKEERIAPRE